MNAPAPTIEAQSQFWNDWVSKSKTWEDNPDNVRRAEGVLAAIDGFVRQSDRILDVGCGTGWLTLELAKRSRNVVGQDLASDVMSAMQQTHPGVRWIGGDILTADVGEPFDAITCLETISHVDDQQKFADRLVDLLVPGGMLVLTSQNPYVWNRTSWLSPPAPGQLRNWPTVERLHDLFGARLALRPIETRAPGGDRGVPRLFHNRLATRLAHAALAAETWVRVREAMGLGRSFLLVGRRKA
jgi:SAM-dependent methyltransferase